jgi:HEAT repeat protein
MRRSLLWLVAIAWLASLTVLTAQPGDAKQADADEQKLKAANLKTDGPSLLDFLRARTLNEDDRVKVEVLIAQLGANAFRVRQQASQELIAKGPIVVEMLKQGMNHPDLEISRRCETCLQKIKEHDYPAEVLSAVVRLIGARKPAGAVEVLLAYLPFADSDNVADDAREVLAKLAMRDGKVDKALVDALTDKVPVRRAAAAEALARAAAEEHKKAVRALLHDANFTVRWRVATALVMAKDKEAVPVLIDLLVDASQSQAWQIEDILFRLTEGQSPPAVSLGADEAARKKCRDTWRTWWQAHADKVDLAVLQHTPGLLGYTDIVLLDVGRVLELDRNDTVRWQIDNLMFPLDLQVLDKDRVLIAEYHGNRVTERNFKGEILWQRAFDGPQMAQRLANGNTFIGGKYLLLEVDPQGKQAFSYNVQGNEGIMKCMKLANGEIVCLLDDGRVVRLDGQGKELRSFRIDLNMKLFGGRIHALPTGRVLIPHHAENKVVEYDANGKIVWQVRIDQPVAATRLPNGNTLVTSMNQNRAVEFDRNGKEVWQFRRDTRVTRAVKR